MPEYGDTVSEGSVICEIEAVWEIPGDTPGDFGNNDFGADFQGGVGSGGG